MRQRNHLVFEAAEALGVPLVVFMGGGMQPIDASLDAFYDLFTDAAAWSIESVWGLTRPRTQPSVQCGP